MFARGLNDPDRLDDEESVLFGPLMQRQIYNYQNVIFQYEHGALDDKIFESMTKAYRLLAHAPGFAHWWRENHQTVGPGVGKDLGVAIP